MKLLLTNDLGEINRGIVLSRLGEIPSGKLDRKLVENLTKYFHNERHFWYSIIDGLKEDGFIEMHDWKKKVNGEFVRSTYYKITKSGWNWLNKAIKEHGYVNVHRTKEAGYNDTIRNNLIAYRDNCHANNIKNKPWLPQVWRKFEAEEDFKGDQPYMVDSKEKTPFLQKAPVFKYDQLKKRGISSFVGVDNAESLLGTSYLQTYDNTELMMVELAEELERVANWFPANEHRTRFLIGKAGTGKTTKVKEIVKQYRPGEVKGLSVAKLAADNLGKVTGIETKSLRGATFVPDWLGYAPFFDGVKLLVVDEFYMIGLRDWAKLFNVLPDDVSLLCVGDSHQLPEIGYGVKYLKDLNADMDNVTELTFNYRNGENDGITRQLEELKHPKYVTIDKWDELPSADYYMAPTKDTVSEINNQIHKRKLEIVKDKKVFPSWPVELYVGCPVMATKNYEDVDNGTQGVVVAGWYIDFGLDEPIEITDELIIGTDLQLGYAMTVSKAQGLTLHGDIVTVLGHSSQMNTQNMLYTAITRADNEGTHTLVVKRDDYGETRYADTLVPSESNVLDIDKLG